MPRYGKLQGPYSGTKNPFPVNFFRRNSMFGQYFFPVSGNDLQFQGLIQNCPASGHIISRETHLMSVSQIPGDQDHEP